MLTSVSGYIIAAAKLHLYEKNLTNVETVKIIIGSVSSGYADYTITVDLNTYANGNELLYNKLVSCPLNKFLKVQYFKGATEVTDVSLIPTSYVSFEYMSIHSSKEYTGVDFITEITLPA